MALATALNLRTFLLMTPRQDGKISLQLPNLGSRLSWEAAELQPLLAAFSGRHTAPLGNSTFLPFTLTHKEPLGCWGSGRVHHLAGGVAPPKATTGSLILVFLLLSVAFFAGLQKSVLS